MVAGRRSWNVAGLLAVAAVACGLLLGGLSAWFLGSVALAGLSAAALTFNFHIPGALVRLFAVGRTAAKYGERIVGHRATLADQVERRVGLFGAMAAAPATRSAGWQLGDEARLADWLDDVEDLDAARLRVDLPAATLALGLLAGLAATALVAPLALLPIGAVLGVLLVLALDLTRTATGAWTRRRAHQCEGAERLGTALASAVPLRAEGGWDAACDAALAALSTAERGMLAVQGRQARLDALAGLVGPVALLAVGGAAWWAGFGAEALLGPVFLAFVWLALGEPLQGASRLVMAQVRRQAARGQLERWTPEADAAGIAPSAIGMLQAALPRTAPDGRAIGAPVALSLTAGRPTVLVGASGSGKTSLLKQVAGWLGDDVLLADGRPVAAADRPALCCLCPHDAAILADTVRANLFAPDAADATLRAALIAVEMDERVAEAGGLDAWITQDALSLGEAQRLNLARAWLSDRPVVLIDEPTEHLDAAQGARILGRLCDRLGDRVLVLSSHRADAALHGVIVDLGVHP